VVFVSGANFYKLLPELDEIWADILARVPNSFLLLYPFNPHWLSSYPLSIQWRMQKAFQRCGVDSNRIIFLNATKDLSKLDIFQVLSGSDVYLDAISYSGAGSIIEALLTGLPTVGFTSELPYHKNRSAAAILKEIGLDELVVADESAYVELAVTLGTSKELRGALRERITKGMARAPFFDSHRFGKMVEAVFEDLIEKREV
jgi:predicted O-linked N-acetylglucosamine transferase (SPINDLY family)